jgi:SAM-dependent methyltransferase
MSDGGYDEGYGKCNCFWGTAPAEMVQNAAAMFVGRRDCTALDLGCGEGKNAADLCRHGFKVIAVDTSDLAIAHAKALYPELPIQWNVADLRSLTVPRETFDLVIATGSLHCLSTVSEIERGVAKMQDATRVGGLNVVYSFNDGPQDMRGHSASFRPTLIPHQHYLSLYSGWSVLRESNIVQSDKHPHNDIDHSHSITRLLAKKPG